MANKETYSCHVHTDHAASMWQEVICHMPYGIFSVALALVFISILYFFTPIHSNLHHYAHVLFHTFHFLHIIFATTGAYIATLRFTGRPYFSLIISFFSAMIFCTLSDIILPWLGGMLLGFNIRLHLCIHTELMNVLFFWAIGLINAFGLVKNSSSAREPFMAVTHFSHIATSAIAALVYLIAEGFPTWYDHMGILFVLLMGAVVVPCTLSDIIMPVLCGKLGRAHEKHTA